MKDDFDVQVPENKSANVDGNSISSSFVNKPDSQIDTSEIHKRQSTLLRDSISSIGRTLKAFHADRNLMKDNSKIQEDIADDEGETYQSDKTVPKMTSCIFKVFDDCRQDALALQFMALCKETFDDSNLGLSLYPYRVIPTRTGASKIPGGILECVPDVRSRDEIGKSGFKSLFDFYISTFGRPDGSDFECARRNLIRSLAAYAVFCYLLRVKDRHNGNLLVSRQGHLVHIDFGFLLGISPGGNLGFETAAFKLTQEMVDIMGGSVDSEAFQIFSELSCRAFLLARDKIDELNSIVIGMADSALPCFMFPDTLLNLRSRFQPKDTDMKACKFWRAETIASAKSVTTTLYDGIQKLQQGIAY
jgi:phosphatidylinositol 4-kinase